MNAYIKEYLRVTEARKGCALRNTLAIIYICGLDREEARQYAWKHPHDVALTRQSATFAAQNDLQAWTLDSSLIVNLHLN